MLTINGATSEFLWVNNCIFLEFVNIGIPFAKSYSIQTNGPGTGTHLVKLTIIIAILYLNNNKVVIRMSFFNRVFYIMVVEVFMADPDYTVRIYGVYHPSVFGPDVAGEVVPVCWTGRRLI